VAGSGLGYVATLNGNYGVVGVEDEVDDESFQFVKCGLSACVKDDKEL
jgi:hypothetical protein